MGSDNVCGPNGYCYTAPLQPQRDTDGPGWALANEPGTYENINFGQILTIKGSFPFSNSAHPGGCNMAFCDGAVRFISATIDGTVYAKILTPAGSKLPIYARQLPVSQDAFVQWCSDREEEGGPIRREMSARRIDRSHGESPMSSSIARPDNGQCHACAEIAGKGTSSNPQAGRVSTIGHAGKPGTADLGRGVGRAGRVRLLARTDRIVGGGPG
jgi:prepilin-type processing-associated H-X9-DG protein